MNAKESQKNRKAKNDLMRIAATVAYFFIALVVSSLLAFDIIAHQLALGQAFVNNEKGQRVLNQNIAEDELILCYNGQSVGKSGLECFVLNSDDVSVKRSNPPDSMSLENIFNRNITVLNEDLVEDKIMLCVSAKPVGKTGFFCNTVNMDEVYFSRSLIAGKIK